MTSKKAAMRIAQEFIIEEQSPKSTVEIRDEICRQTKHGISCSGLKGILNDRSPVFKRAGMTNRERSDGSTYSLQLWTVRERVALTRAKARHTSS